ncbi:MULTISPECIES: restriction endonuclease subunit S [Vibrio]|uniref:restriction endonuclease subunit S n=1 Tax=Vibrio TaxID=662 RepID=UPI00148E2B76|nr:MULTISPECIES: restriction endonuclease subunit S [Vibrio]MBU2931225.1 restriction endonuclease subunit S [Vibrio cyclitrophicus]NOJ06398.1 hypothetical protein [Vibrio splendidus]
MTKRNESLKQLTKRFMPYNFRTRIAETERGLKVIQPKDIQNEQVDWNGVVTTEFASKKHIEHLQDGDLLIISKGLKPQTIVFKARCHEEKVICSSMFHHYRLNRDDVNPYYLAFVLNHNSRIKNQIEVGAKASIGVKVYSRETIEDLIIPIPTKKEQDTIVALHDNIKQQQQHYQELMDSNQAMLSSIASQLTK